MAEPKDGSIFSVIFGDQRGLEYASSSSLVSARRARRRRAAAAEAAAASPSSSTSSSASGSKKKKAKRRSRRYQRPVFKEPGSKLKDSATEAAEAKKEDGSGRSNRNDNKDVRGKRSSSNDSVVATSPKGRTKQRHDDPSETAATTKPIPIVKELRDELKKMTSQEEENKTLMQEEEVFRTTVRARSMLERRKQDRFDKRAVHNRIPEEDLEEHQHHDGADKYDDISSAFPPKRVISDDSSVSTTLTSRFLDSPIEMSRDFSDLSQFLHDFGEKLGIVRAKKAQPQDLHGGLPTSVPTFQQTRNDSTVSNRLFHPYSCYEYNMGYNDDSEDDISAILREDREELPEVSTGASF
mmetsp:Transcript_6368/g.18729  ORF Transcript_6368/g.18729 Transcript_6368/m.18729 type:complete len:353 (+) Transcript_6368:132-1190(+)|eukprot:CAMPEP_0119562760 /NCGR_PEP_ID=MMETSP1352-20130426/21461_1 /TAXON_ID=265584 /ORGANISM="Stauroneis constricta, Strain CCMP1120" /LENGTH=352 /DNA_ID=CAMNT_0007611227 /DNA_START=97 /DNA_END=1155 /DNA_ORIENTATION=-